MYPLPFPYNRLKGRNESIRILDPFCGRGTTNFAARLLGLESVGIDSNPVAHAIAQAKLLSVSASDVVDACRESMRGRGRVSTPQGEFWELCYHSDTLSELCQLRRHLLGNETLSDAEKMLQAIVVGILHGPKTKGKPTYLSSQMPRTYATKPASAINFWKKNGHKPEYVSVMEAVGRRADYLLKSLPKETAGEVRKGDSRDAGSYEGLGEFDVVFTSPPYLGMRTYWPDQWLRNWFMGGPDFVEYSKADQIQSQDIERFTADLSQVWRNCAGVGKRETKMIIRFGALPSYSGDPRSVIKESLQSSGADWKVDTIRDAGSAAVGRRQAEQFKTKKSEPIQEIDVYCTLTA